MKTIIRIEHPSDGYGIFMDKLLDVDENIIGTRKVKNTYDFAKRMSDRHTKFNTPYHDNLDTRKDSKIWYCAYKSLDQMKEWITSKEIKAILKRGYIVLMLEVKEHQEGRDQIIYTKESIKSSKDISALFN